MALEKKVGTGFEGGHSYKSSFDSSTNLLLHQQLAESWGLKEGSPVTNQGGFAPLSNVFRKSSSAYTTNTDGAGIFYSAVEVDPGLTYDLEGNTNFELNFVTSRGNDNFFNSGIRIVCNGGSKEIIGSYASTGIKWSDDGGNTETTSSFDWLDGWSPWHIKCVIFDDSGTSTLRLLSVGKSQTVNKIIDYSNINSIDSVVFFAGRKNRMNIDDLTIWEDTSDANAKSEIDAIEAGTSSLQPHIRYIAPMADQTAYTTNGTTDDWTFKSVSNKADLTDGADATYSEMTTNEGGLITDSSQTDLSGTIAAAGYTVNTVESIAAAGFKVEDNEENTFVGTLNSDGTGGGTTKTAVVAQGSSTPAYIRFDEADLTTEGITKNTKAATTFKLQ